MSRLAWRSVGAATDCHNRSLARRNSAPSPARAARQAVVTTTPSSGTTAWRSQASDPGIRCVVAVLLLAVAFDIARKGWHLSWVRRAAASVGATVAILHVNLVLAPGVWLLSEQFKAVYALLGIPSVPTAFWAGLPLWALSLLSILAHDFANYWNHRAMHMKWLWPVHAIHHSDPDVNAMTTYRIHALETLVMPQAL